MFPTATHEKGGREKNDMTYNLGSSSALVLVIIHVRHLLQKQELPVPIFAVRNCTISELLLLHKPVPFGLVVGIGHILWSCRPTISRV